MQQTWQFDYVVADEVVNFVAKLGSSLRSLEQSLEFNFIEAVSKIMNSLTQEGKAILRTGGERIVDH